MADRGVTKRKHTDTMEFKIKQIFNKSKYNADALIDKTRLSNYIQIIHALRVMHLEAREKYSLMK